MYWNGMKISGKLTFREKLVCKWYPCPGCISHNVSEQKRKLLFKRFHDRPQLSWLVYWRSHPKEFKKMRESIGKQNCSVLGIV